MSDQSPTLFQPSTTPQASEPEASAEQAPRAQESLVQAPSAQVPPLSRMPSQPNQPPLAPPTTPGPIQRPYRKVYWPEFLGSVCLALGIMGVITSLISSLPRILGGLERYMHVVGMGPQFQSSLEKNKILSDAALLLYTIASVWMCVIGVQFIRRSPSTRTSITWWIPLRVIVAIAYAYITMELNRANISNFQSGGAVQMQPVQLVAASTYLTTAMMFLWWLTFPAVFAYLLLAQRPRAELERWAAKGSTISPAKSQASQSTSAPRP